MCPPEGGIVGGNPGREFVHVDLAEDDGAFCLQGCHDRGIAQGPVALKAGRPGRRRQSSRANIILYDEWHTREQAERTAIDLLLIRGICIAKDSRWIERDNRSEITIGNPGEQALCIFPSGEIAPRYGLGDRCRTELSPGALMVRRLSHLTWGRSRCAVSSGAGYGCTIGLSAWYRFHDSGRSRSSRKTALLVGSGGDRPSARCRSHFRSR